jgi:hypothetical protein
LLRNRRRRFVTSSGCVVHCDCKTVPYTCRTRVAAGVTAHETSDRGRAAAR